MPDYIAEKTNAQVITLRFQNWGADFKQWFYINSDRHHDSVYCERGLEEAHLKEAVKRDAIILDCGDLFDAMQGKADPRRSMDELRPEYRRDDYYDYVVKDCADWYEPYAKNWVLFGYGNHETAVIKNCGTDLTERLVSELRRRGHQNCFKGGYGGWIRIMLSFQNKGTRTSLRVKYHHSGGGGTSAPVTHGAIQANRQAVYLPDADLVCNGHNHESYIFPMARERINDAGNISTDIAYFIRTPGFKQTAGKQLFGFDVEKIVSPKPIGGIWMLLEAVDGHKPRPKMTLMQDLQ